MKLKQIERQGLMATLERASTSHIHKGYVPRRKDTTKALGLYLPEVKKYLTYF